MAVIVTGNFSNFLVEGATKAFGAAVPQYPTVYTRFAEVRSSDKNAEDYTMVSGLGMAVEKTQGSVVEMDTMRQQFTKRFQHVTYGLGFSITQEAIEDNQSEEIAVMRARELKLALMKRKEVVVNALLNNADSSSYTLADGVKLLSTAHPTLAGNQSNVLATAADLSEASLESLLINVRKVKDHRGVAMAAMPVQLIVPAESEHAALRIVMSSHRSSDSTNAINTMNGRFPKGVLVNPFMTDTDMWLVQTDVPNGVIVFNRRPMTLSQDGDHDTDVMKFKGTERYVAGTADWRCLFGSPGA